MANNKKAWVRKEQLDIPLNELDKGINSSMTTRSFVRIMEKTLGYPHVEIETLSYEDMNEYIDSLSLDVYMRSKEPTEIQ